MESFLGNFYGLLAIFSGHTAVVVVQIVNFFTYATLSDAIFCLLVILQSVGGSPGLEVKEGIHVVKVVGSNLDGHFFTLIVKFVLMFVCKRPKRAGNCPFLNFAVIL